MAYGTEKGGSSTGPADVAVDTVSGSDYQRVKLVDGTEGNATGIPGGAGGLLVDLGANNDVTVTGSVTATVASTTVTGTVAVTQSGTWDEVGINDSGNSITVDDGAGSLTVDGSVTAVSGTAANLKAEVVGTGTFAVQADTELTTADLDTGAGTDTRAVVGIVGSKSGGGELIPGDITNGLDVDVTRLPALVAGTAAIGKLAANDGVDIGDVTINNSTGGSAVNVQDGGNSLTVDYATTGSGTATGALRVELANNGTGVLATVGAVTAITNAVTVNAHAVTNAGTFATQTVVGGLTQGVVDETGASAVDAAAVGGGTPHDAVDSGNPLKIGGYAKAAAPTDVSGDGDRVNAWYLRNGAQAQVLTAAGALIGGDAANGLDVDITRQQGAGTGASAQVTVTNSSTTIIAARAARRTVLITNKQTVAVSVDASGGAAVYATHYVLDPGASLTLETAGAVTGITSAAYSASGDAKVHTIELY